MKEKNELGLTRKELLLFGKRLKEMRLERKLSQKELGILCGYPAGSAQSRIGHYESANKCPTLKALQMLSIVLKTTVPYLMEGIAPLYRFPRKPTIEGVLVVPVITQEEALIWSRDTMEKFKKDVNREFTPVPANVNPNGYAMKLQDDDNIAPQGSQLSFAVGECVFVDPDYTAHPNNYVIIAVENGKKALLRQYIEMGGKKFFKPLNERYPLINFEDAVIKGVAINKMTPLL